MAKVFQKQVRCARCNRRLADVVDEIQIGQLILELKCPRCGHPHLEVLRSTAASNGELKQPTLRQMSTPTHDRPGQAAAASVKSTITEVM